MLWNEVPIYEKQPVLPDTCYENGMFSDTEVIEHILIHNPSDKERWFYFIENNQSDYLLQMLASGFNVNTINPDGEHILNLAFLYRHYNLAGLALASGANVFHTDRTGEHALYQCCYSNVSLDIFTSVWQKSTSLEPLLSKNHVEITAIETLFDDESNLPKIRWMAEHFPGFFHFSYHYDFISIAQKRAQSHIVYFLKGKEHLFEKLEQCYMQTEVDAIMSEETIKI